MTGRTGRLSGKVAIITGASKGTGAVMARQFVNEGAKVVLAARREAEVLEAAKEAGGGAIGVRADITNEADIRNMVDRALDAFGQVDILLNNAVIPGQDKFVWEQTLENWNAVIGVALTGPMLCAREVLQRSMLERRSW
jgi:NAD(P)-dependent dehydrogenase (short-subunit alcohol dehydrogenase family)